MAKRLIPDESHFLMLASAGLELAGSGNNFPLDCSLGKGGRGFHHGSKQLDCRTQKPYTLAQTASTVAFRIIWRSWGHYTKRVESRGDAVSLGSAYLFPPLSFGGASLAEPWFRFHIPLIEPDRRC
jgi:hypothetical protein